MNQTTSSSVPAHKAIQYAAITLFLSLLPASAAWAQATGADGAPSEAARRAALSPYRFILQNATAPARKPAPPAEKKAAPSSSEAPTTARVLEAPVPAPAATAAVAPAAVAPQAAPAQLQPAETLAARTRPAEPPPPPVRREIIPVRTDEPRLSNALMREKPSGLVRVRFDIHPDGSTGEVTVVSTTNRALNKATLDAVHAWKFQPVDEVLTVETEVAYKFD